MNSQQSVYDFIGSARALAASFVALALTLSACSGSLQNLPDVDGLSKMEVVQLEELAEEGNCAELLAARDFFEIGVDIGALATGAPVIYVEHLISRAKC